ncbi:MAG: uroporphyrinogen-III synthase [Coxiellaceae bacterium]|nr:uroporphyrinogen-III synthase [Coxiellaceae bacterium]
MSKVLITKPAHQATVLLEQLNAIGLEGFSFPSIDILPIDNSQRLQQTALQLEQVDIAIFVSANAVKPAIKQWPNNRKPGKIVAIGPATASALQQLGYEVDLIADPPSSEGLLQHALMQANAIVNKNIRIFCGENPKTLLQQSLRAANAQVDVVTCYRRSCTQPSPETTQQLMQQSIDCIATCSLESLLNLYRILAPQHLAWLLGKPLIVINSNMQQLAIKMGFLKSRIWLADNASNAAVIKTISDVMQLNP